MSGSRSGSAASATGNASATGRGPDRGRGPVRGPIRGPGRGPGRGRGRSRGRTPLHNPETGRRRPRSSRKSCPRRTTTGWSRRLWPISCARAVRPLARNPSWRWTIRWRRRPGESDRRRPSIPYDAVPRACPSRASPASRPRRPDRGTRGRRRTPGGPTRMRSEGAPAANREPTTRTRTGTGRGTRAGRGSRTTADAAMGDRARLRESAADCATGSGGSGADRS